MTYKLSKYNVTSRDAQDKYLLVYNVRSKALLSLPLTKGKLIFSSEFDINSLPLEVMLELEKKKIVIDERENELETIINENSQYQETCQELYTTLISHGGCNLGCRYCGQEHQDRYLSPSRQEQIVKLIENKIKNRREMAPDHPYKSLKIGWFGGEPLLGLKNIKSLSQKLSDLEDHDLRYQAKVITNGLLLDEATWKILLDECKVKLVEITLDGTEDEHNKRRPAKSALSNSFRTIYQNILTGVRLIERMPDKSITLNIRSNVDCDNLHNIENLYSDFARDGVLNGGFVNCYTSPVYSWGGKGNNHQQENSFLKAYAAKEITWLKQLSSYGVTGVFLPTRKTRSCMANGLHSFLVDLDGNIFQCSEIFQVGRYVPYKDNVFYRGNLDSIDISAGKSFNRRISCEQKNFEDLCHRCQLFPVCASHCPKQWLEGNRPCPSFKYNIKERIELSYEKTCQKDLT